MLLLNRLCSFTQDLQVARVPEEAGSALPGDFLGNAETNQVVQGHRHRWNGYFERIGQGTDAGKWFLLHVLMNAQSGRRRAPDCLDSVSVFSEEI